MTPIVVSERDSSNAQVSSRFKGRAWVPGSVFDLFLRILVMLVRGLYRVYGANTPKSVTGGCRLWAARNRSQMGLAKRPRQNGTKGTEVTRYYIVHDLYRLLLLLDDAFENNERPIRSSYLKSERAMSSAAS